MEGEQAVHEKKLEYTIVILRQQCKKPSANKCQNLNDEDYIKYA